MGSTRGQATVDYVALIAVLAVLFAATLALMARGAPGIVNAVHAKLRHALCVVGGGSCPDLRSRPCTVASTRDLKHVALNVLLVRLDHDRWVLRERMSDGSVRLTIARSGAAGVEVGAGGSASVTVKGLPIAIADEARAGAQGMLASGRVYFARDEREADAFMRAIRDGRSPPSRPREVFVEGGIRGLAQFGVGSSLAGTLLEGLSGTMIGARRDRRTGEVTLALSSAASGWGAVTVALGGPAGTADRATTLGLTLDRRRRPIELSVSAAGTLAAGAQLAPGLSRALGGAGARATSTGGRRWELSARLDLRDPLAAAAWARFRRQPGSGDAIRELGETIRDRAHIDVRAYRTASSSGGAAAGLALGLRLGGEFEHTTDRSRLIAASARPSGGLWEPRIDCVPS